MIIYETLLKAKESLLPSLAGIYYFKNKINNKYYVGRSFCIKDRFFAHYRNFIEHKNYPIYKAIEKYGEENFEFAIIETYIIKNNKIEISKLLDEKEIYYIEKYNSYGSSGYNQTLGGDGGILGYKMTENQKEKISQAVKRRARDGRNIVYLYNALDDSYLTFNTCVDAASYLDISRDALVSNLRGNSKICVNKYIIAKSEEILQQKIEYYKNNKDSKKGKFEIKYTIEEYLKIKEKYPDLTAKELAKMLNVCPKTIYNYEHSLENPSFVFKGFKCKILNIETGEEQIVTAKEGAQLFNVQSDTFRSTVNKYSKSGTIYKKKYKLIKL